MAAATILSVCADDYVSAVRVHADRVHDALRRNGCPAQSATEITASTAIDLLETLAHRPETVPDLVGWWFHRALRLAERMSRQPRAASRRRSATRDGAPATTVLAGNAPATGVLAGGVPATSVLAGSSGETTVRAALDSLGPRERLAVLLRDGYDLAPTTVATALGPGEDAVDCYARGRLQLVAHYDHRAEPDLADHPGRPPADLVALTGLADGSLTGTTARALRRHVDRCPVCEEIVEVAAKGRRLVAALPLAALADEDRDALLEHVQSRAAELLPSREEMVLAGQVAAVSPVLRAGTVIAALTGAILLGVLTGYLLGSAGSSAQRLHLGSPTRAVPARAPASASARPSPRATPPPSTPSPAASASTRPVAVRSTSPVPSRAPAPTASPAAPAAISIDPTSGPNGTVVTVTGSGFGPGTTVTVQFLDHAGTPTSTAQTVTSSNGDFTAQVTASNSPSVLPQSCTVTAAGGSRRASSTFDDTSPA